MKNFELQSVYPSKRKDNAIQQIDIQIVRQTDLCKLLSISSTTLWRLRQSSSTFPKPIKLNSDKLIGWKIVDIRNWLDSLDSNEKGEK
jgi:predicted DNA-binding transcriptional regulator AlpA